MLAVCKLLTLLMYMADAVRLMTGGLVGSCGGGEGGVAVRRGAWGNSEASRAGGGASTPKHSLPYVAPQ